MLSLIWLQIAKNRKIVFYDKDDTLSSLPLNLVSIGFSNSSDYSIAEQPTHSRSCHDRMNLTHYLLITNIVEHCN